MPHQTKIFRVFISSTFTDMRGERSMLKERYNEYKIKLIQICPPLGQSIEKLIKTTQG